MSRDNSNYKAGLFVVAGLTLAFIAIVVLSDIRGLFTPMQEVTMRYPIADGLLGLKEGANVTIGNRPAGSITRIADEVTDDRVTAQLVTFELPKRYRLFDNARIELVVPPLGAGTSINIRNVGYDAASEEQPALMVQGWRVIRLDKNGQPVDVPADLASFAPDQLEAKGEAVMVDAAGRVKLGDSWQYKPGELMRGGRAGSQLVADLVKEIGISDVQKQQIGSIIANVDTILAKLAEDPEKLKQIIANVHAITEALKDDVPAITKDTREVMAKAKALADTTNTTIDKVHSMVMENGDDLRAIVAKGRTTMDNAEQISQRMKDQTLGKIDEALDKAKAAMADVKETADQLKAFAVSQRPVLERTIANARLISDQLKLASIEIRRSPWRLLYKPTDKELDTDNIYGAARSFALAAGTLDSTAESLRVLLERYGDKLDAKDQNVQLMLDNLHETFEKFDKAENQFWQALDEQTGK